MKYVLSSSGDMRRHCHCAFCAGILCLILIGSRVLVFTKYESVDDDVMKDIEELEIVKKINAWPYGIKFAVWNKVDEHIPKSFDEGWLNIIEKLIEPGIDDDIKFVAKEFDAGCNIVDIGANTGDTPLVLAVAAKGGTVVAFEMGPPIELLRINKRSPVIFMIIH